MLQLQEQSMGDDATAGSPRYSASKAQPALSVRARVAKLLDSYLAEVARDSKLPLAKFQSLAEALPEGSRLCDDGLYRAVDTYLKVCSRFDHAFMCAIDHSLKCAIDHLMCVDG
jgi:hypothetical protein